MLVQNLMRVFFRLLYHPFAFTYDLVADTVSFGRWQEWVATVLPFIEGTRVLELGHGPGHLQKILLGRGGFAVALDESPQMVGLARRRLGPLARLTRGLAQALPFQSGTFHTIVSTFPTKYIFEDQTIAEMRRCLSDGGRLVILPVAWPHSPILNWLYRATGESPAALNASIASRFQDPFRRAGFDTAAEVVEVRSSTLLIVTARKR